MSTATTTTEEVKVMESVQLKSDTSAAKSQETVNPGKSAQSDGKSIEETAAQLVTKLREKATVKLKAFEAEMESIKGSKESDEKPKEKWK